MTSKKKNLYIFSRRQRNLNNGRQIISDWLYQNIVNGENMGDSSPTVGGRTIYVTPNLNDTIYWMTDDKDKFDSFLLYKDGYMPIPLGTKDLNKAKLNFYKKVPWTTTYNNDTISINARNKALQGFKKGGEMNKFQTGGKSPNKKQQDAVMLFVQALAEVLKTDPNQVVLAAQANPEALKSAVQVYQQTQDIQQAALTFAQTLQLKTQAAKHGAKLNYLKSLKNKCAEDEELYYFKKGGKAGCGCKKKEDGGKVEDKKESVVSKFKKACGGSKMKFRTGGLTPKKKNLDQASKDSIEINDNQNMELMSERPGKLIPNPKYDKGKTDDRALLWVPDRTKAPYKKEEKIKKNCGGSKMKFKKGDKVKSAGAGCIAKFKMHKLGGSLNGILFMLKGKDLPTAPKAEDRYKNSTKKQETIKEPDETFRRIYPSREVKTVTANNGLFPASILQIVYRGIVPKINDTVYVETPEYSNPFVKVLPRKVLLSQGLFTRKFVVPTDLIGGRYYPTNVQVPEEEYETLKRRFNTAWNLAK